MTDEQLLGIGCGIFFIFLAAALKQMRWHMFGRLKKPAPESGRYPLYSQPELARQHRSPRAG